MVGLAMERHLKELDRDTLRGKLHLSRRTYAASQLTLE